MSIPSHYKSIQIIHTLLFHYQFVNGTNKYVKKNILNTMKIDILSIRDKAKNLFT